MSTDPIPSAPDRLPPSQGVGAGTIAYRIIVVLLLGVCAWNVGVSQQPASAVKPALALPGNSWRRTYEFDKKQSTAEMEFRTDGSISQLGSGHGTFEIHSPVEITLDPTSPTGGLFGWPVMAKERWIVSAVGDDLLLQRKSFPKQTILLQRVKKVDEQSTQILQALQRIQIELAQHGRDRRSDNESLRREIQLLREAEKKRAEEGKK